MKKTVSIGSITMAIILMCAADALGVPAYPYKVTVPTDNGKTVEIFMRGDEHQKYAVTTDGYTLLSDNQGWWYAQKRTDGLVMRSPYKLAAIADESAELRNFKSVCPKGIVPKRNNMAHAHRSAAQESAPQRRMAAKGERRALVILMQYKDMAFKKTKSDFEALFNTLDYHEGGTTGSVRDYYRYASQGQLDYVSDVYGPYTSQYNMRHYGANSGYGGNDAHSVDLCIEAVKSLPEDFDYTPYDNDGDGVLDNVHIIFAGYGEEAGASSDAIWSHEYPHRIQLKNEVGFSLAGYSCSPELRGNHGAGISHIGVVCHELGHALGAMDYYDTNYGTGGEYEGTGKWDIMAGGSWNDDGRTPPNFNPYVRTAVFGWNEQVELQPNQHVVMPRFETDNAEKTPVYRMSTGSDGDYFLLENRQQNYFDKALPGSGLMIFHVHPNIGRFRATNTVNATHPQGLYPVCASGSNPQQKSYGNINTAQCPFPGNKNIRVFSAESSPAAIAWNKSSAKVALTSITQNSTDGSISFATGQDIVVEPDEPDLPVEQNLIYRESFEASISNKMTISSIWGNEIWRVYRKGFGALNDDFFPLSADGKRTLMLYGPKGTATNESEATTRSIEVEPGANYTLSFRICAYAVSADAHTQFKMFVEDEYGEYSIYTQSDTISTWKSIDIPLTFAGSSFKYKLYGCVFSGAVFVDDIRLYKEETPASLVAKQSDYVNEYRLYSSNGLFLGAYHKVPASLPTGLYLVRYGGHTRKVLIK